LIQFFFGILFSLKHETIERLFKKDDTHRGQWGTEKDVHPHYLQAERKLKQENALETNNQMK
jgi:hypothetical protein